MANKKVSQLTSKPSVLTTDLFPIADPSTGQLYKTTISDLGTAIGSGVSSVNSLVGAVVLDTDDIQELVSPTNKWFTDTRARAALSASSPLTYNSGTGVFSLPQANGSTNGFLSSADWTTFNNKLSTATAASTYVPYTGATGNVNLGLDYSLTAALIIKSGGTSTQFLKADGSIDTNTYLTTSSAASTYLPLTGGTLTGNLLGTNITISNSLIAKGGTFNGGASYGGVVTIDGLGSDLLMNRANTSNGSSITFLTNAVEKWNIGLRSAGTTDNFFIYNSNLTANAVTINSATSAATFASSATATNFILSGGTPNTGLYFGHTDRVVLANYTIGGGIDFETNGGAVNMTLFSSGNLGIGASMTDAGYKLDVNGNTRIIGSVRTTGASSAFVMYRRDTDVYAGGWYSASGAITLDMSSPGTVLNFSTSGAATFSSSVTATALSLSNTDGYFGTINSTGANGGYFAWQTSGTTIADIGTLAQIFGSGGSTNFGINARGARDLAFGSNNTERLRITSSGNVGIGTTSPSDYSGYTTLHLNGKSGANGGVLRLTAYDSTSSANIYAGGSALNINTTSAVPIKFLTRDTTRMQILDSGAIIAGNLIGNQYSMTSGSGTGTAIVDTNITYNTGDYGGYGRGVTYEVVFNGNPNGNGSAAYFAQYMGILIIYTGWSGSAVTTYIQYTQLAGGNNIGALTLTPVFWNGSTESSSIGVYTTGAQIRLKISGYNSGATGQDQSVYLRRIS